MNRPRKAHSGATALERGMGVWGGTSANMLAMIGVGPFITIPLALSAMGGPQAMLAWLAGAFISLCDGLVWAELGAAMPASGGSYAYLREAFNPRSWGRMLSFLFLWQAIIVGPITIASGAIGFAQYSAFLAPGLQGSAITVLAVAVCLLNTALVYRDIRSINTLSVCMCAVVLATTLWLLFGGFTHFNGALAFHFPPHAFQPSFAFFAGLGSATLIALYDYSGYFTVCFIGAEMRRPARTIPRSIIISVLIVGLLYLLMNISIIGVIPWNQAMVSKAVIADFIQHLYGSFAGKVAAILVLWAAFGSVFALLLGYSRIPYAAATEGQFFSLFARIHPRKHFPTFSTIILGAISAAACLLSLSDLITYMIVLQILLQFLAQCAAIFVLRRKRNASERPYSMPLYPLPVLIAIAGWLYILIASGLRFILGGLFIAILGAAAFLWHARRQGEWPFQSQVPRDSVNPI